MQSRQTKPEGLATNKTVAKAGGSAAKATKESIEESTGKPVITSKWAAELNHMVVSMIETSADMGQSEEE